MQAKIIDKIFKIFHENNNHPKTELIYNNDFTLLVAVVLSAQATDVSVNKATKELFKIYNTPKLMVELGEEKLLEYIKSINFFQNKAKYIIILSRQLIALHDSKVPNSFSELMKLAGVGRKTANVILNCLFNGKNIAVDTHVFRVSKRIGLSQGENPENVENDLINNINDKWKHHAHNWLVLHGRYVCKAIKPDCNKCIIKDFCEYYNDLLQL
jgi:endonuclease-3